MKTKKQHNKFPGEKKFLFILFSLFLLLYSFSPAQAVYTYELMEKIPGFESISGSDFPNYILAIYKFAIWTVGIAALLMIIIGGFMYMTSAGNTSRMDTAKRVIFDALYGLIVAFAAWLLLYVINPDLVKVNISLKAVTTTTTESPSKAPSVTGCSDINSTLASELEAANNGVPTALLAAFMKRECASAMTDPNACSSNNSYGAGGPMQFIDSTWNSLGCSGSKFNRADALKCAAKKISQDSGGDYSEAGVEKAARAYCGSCTDVNACGGDYCDGIWSNYQGYLSC